MIKSLSVFFPCVNEEGNIETIVGKAVSVLDSLKIDYEIIIVNDGSTDNTAVVADDLAKKNPKVRVIHHQKNLGYGEALKSGFYNAKYDLIVYTDGDGQFDFSQIHKFLEKIEENDLIIGYRIKRQDPFFRILFKKGWAFSLWIMFGLTLKDVDCGFKMVKRKVLEKIPHLESQRGAMINAELAIKVRKAGFKTGQVGVNHFPRLSGKPTGAGLKVILSSYLDLLRLWWKLKDSRILFLALLGVILIAAFLRFYRLSEYMTFLGDEGRDAMIVSKMLVEGNMPFIGPPTSVGNIYLGPLYYYMMAIPMALFWLSPVAAAGMNALIGVVVVMFIYYLSKIWFGRVPALIASFLYAISSVTIIYSRSSWNPNPVPFFALLGVWASYKAYKGKNFLWFILVSISLAAALQMHYLALLLIPVFLSLWIYQVKKGSNKHLFAGTFGGVIAFLTLMSPLVFFDLKHNFLNYKAITALLSSNESVGFNPLGIFVKVPQLFFNNLIGRYLTAENLMLTIILAVVVSLPIINLIWQKYQKKQTQWPMLALTLWLGFGLIGLSFYKSSIYDHYLGFLNPVLYLFLACSISLTLKAAKKKMERILAVSGVGLVLIVLTILNLQKNPLNFAPNNQFRKTEEISKILVSEANNKPYNFALVAENNYDSAYQFFLNKCGISPKEVSVEKTGQLFVICEDKSCDPTHNPKHEIAAYGYSKIEWEKDLIGVKLYKLIPNPGGKP